jgi:hypothetical protein
MWADWSLMSGGAKMVGIMTIRTLKSGLMVSLISGGLLVIGVAPASALFIIDPAPGGDQFDIDVANKNVADFTGHTDGLLVSVHTTGNVDTGGGFATIKPIKDGLLTDLLFTPDSETDFSAFSFRGQLSDGGNVIVKVQDQKGDLPQSFTFTPSATGDFDRIGILGTLGETINFVEVTGGFKEFKQVEFSLAEGVSPVPEPTTLSLLGVCLVGLFIAGRRQRRRA